jgi:predicted dehydrogenase
LAREDIEAGITQNINAYAQYGLMVRITVDIILPITVLPDMIRLCLAHGKHVLSEKPVAPTTSEGKVHLVT